METNNPFKVGDKVYHYSTKEPITILKFTQDNLMAFVDYRYNLIKTSELSFKPYDLVNGGLTHKRPVDFSILNETDWFYVECSGTEYECQRWFANGEIFSECIAFNIDSKNIYSRRSGKVCDEGDVILIRKCTEQELEEIKTIFPEEFKQKSLFERIEHEIKMSSSPVSGIIISDHEDGFLKSSHFCFGPIHETKLIPIYVSKTNMPKGKIILF